MPGGSDTELIKKSLHRLGLSLDDQANPPILKILNVPKKAKLLRKTADSETHSNTLNSAS